MYPLYFVEVILALLTRKELTVKKLWLAHSNIHEHSKRKFSDVWRSALGRFTISLTVIRAYFPLRSACIIGKGKIMQSCPQKILDWAGYMRHVFALVSVYGWKLFMHLTIERARNWVYALGHKSTVSQLDLDLNIQWAIYSLVITRHC